MLLTSVKAVDFRNYELLDLSFSDGVNIIYGDNAAGKTNILEAAFMFAGGKSFRGCKDREMIRFGCPESGIKIGFESGNTENNLEITLRKNAKKRFFRDGAEIRKLSEYLGYFRAVIFTPDHLGLVKGSPEGRRKFVDMAICQSFPRCVSSLSEYNRLLMQKNALLKNDKPDAGLLAVYNERLAEVGAAISVNRLKYITRLSECASALQRDMSGGTEELRTAYISQAGGLSTAEEFRAAYNELYKSKAEVELKAKISLIGTHKDDFSVYINEKNAKLYASQGQQRTSVLALKLAEGELSKKLTGEYPVFLFDDILSELDMKRREFILERLNGRQVLITGCEKDYFESNITSSERIFVKEGKANVCTPQ